VLKDVSNGVFTSLIAKSGATRDFLCVSAPHFFFCGSYFGMLILCVSGYNFYSFAYMVKILKKNTTVLCFMAPAWLRLQQNDAAPASQQGFFQFLVLGMGG
jgi:hypothetical protein